MILNIEVDPLALPGRCIIFILIWVLREKFDFVSLHRKPILGILVSFLFQMHHPVVDHVPEVSVILDLFESDEPVKDLVMDTLFEEKPLLFQGYVKVRQRVRLK